MLLLRRWLDELAGGGPRYGLAEPGAPPPQQLVSLSRMQILDRWEQHTRVCPSCSRVRRRLCTPFLLYCLWIHLLRSATQVMHITA